MIYLQLFWEFFQTGLFAVGGGLATLPFLQSIAERYPWFTTEELSDMIAIAESTPGPIGINMATYAGVRAAGLLGGIVATLSEVLPSLIIMAVIAALMGSFHENKYVKSALSVLRPASVGLIAAAIAPLIYNSLIRGVIESPGWVSWVQILIFGILFALSRIFKKIHPIVLIFCGALCGIALKL